MRKTDHVGGETDWQDERKRGCGNHRTGNSCAETQTMLAGKQNGRMRERGCVEITEQVTVELKHRPCWRGNRMAG